MMEAILTFVLLRWVIIVGGAVVTLLAWGLFELFRKDAD